MCLIKKLCIVFKQDFGMKSKFKFWFLQPLTLEAVCIIAKLVAYCSRHQPMQATNIWAKAKVDATTKMLQIIPIASIFHISNGNSHRT